MKKDRIPAYDFVRVVCMMGIVAFHYFSHLEEFVTSRYMGSANSSWGNILVTVFFAMSGTLIYRSNTCITTLYALKKYYIKRWKSIFPAFYLVFGFCYLNNAFLNRNFFYIEPKGSILLSVLGLDGYFYYTGENYYILGEWFLGAILILYVLYPLILKLFERAPLLVLCIALEGCIWAVCGNVFEIDSFRNILSCLFSFVAGMYLGRYQLLEKRIVRAGTAAVLAVFLLVPFPLNDSIAAHITGLCLYVVLYSVGETVTKLSFIRVLLRRLGRISYPVYLIHHLIIVHVLSSCHPRGWECGALLAVIFVYILAAAEILRIVVEGILNSGEKTDKDCINSRTKNKSPCIADKKSLE